MGTYLEEQDYLKDSVTRWTRQIFAERGIRLVPEELGEKITYKGPEHRMRTILNNHPRIPVPTTATKIATGAASRNSSMDK